MARYKNGKEQCSLYFESDLVEVIDREAGKRNLKRSEFCSVAIEEYIARLYASKLCIALSQNRKEK